MRSNKYLLCLSLVVAAVFVFTQTQPCRAQIRGMPKLYGEYKMPEVGSYSIYKVTHTANKVEKITKLSIVGKEKSEGGVQKTVDEGEIKKIVEEGAPQKIVTSKGEDLYWYEVAETDPKTGTTTIMKMLISGNPQEIETFHRMIMKSGKNSALELPPEFFAISKQIFSQDTTVEKPKIKNLGTEKVKIKDKTFKCEHLRYTFKDKTTAEVWTNTKVPFGVIKSTSPEATMELLEYGADAVSAIKEKPELLQMPQQK